MSRVSGIVVGAILFTVPFLRYGAIADHQHGATPHSDHGARYGGLVVMVGEHHLEIVDEGHAIDVYLSDARRLPLRAAGATVAFDDEPPRKMDWRSDRLHIDAPSFNEATYDVALPSGERVRVTVPSLR